MAIEKNYMKVATVSRFDSDSMSSDNDELCRRNSVESLVDDDDDDDDGYDDADSGAGSDDFDLLELGETNSEFCQVGDQTCCVPFELYDLPDLQGILSLESWNGCLTDDEHFGLAKYLPDLDQEMYMRTLKELFEGGNFHFGSPLAKLFQMLKGGLCEPRVCLYRQGMSFFQRHKHYHLLRKHQDSMVASFLQMREAWKNCKGYSIEEKLRVLNVVKSKKSLMGERNGDVWSDSSEMEEAGEALCGMKSKGRATSKKGSHLDLLHSVNPAYKHIKKHPKVMLKMGGSKAPSLDEMASSHQHGYQSMKYDPYVAKLVPPRGVKATTYDAMAAQQMRKQMAGSDHERHMIYGIASQRDWNVVKCNTMNHGGSGKSGKKYEVSRVDYYNDSSYSSFPLSGNNDVSGHKRNPNINQLSDIKVLTSKPSTVRALFDPTKEKYPDPSYVGQVRPTKGRALGMVLKGNMSDFPNVDESYSSKNREGKTYFAGPSSFDHEGRDVVSKKKLKIGREFPDSRLSTAQSSQLSQLQMDDRIYGPKKQAKLLPEHVKGMLKYLPDFTVEGNRELFTGVGDLNITVPDFTPVRERQKGNEAYMVIDGQEGSDPFGSIQLRKRIKRKAEVDIGSLDTGVEEVPITEVAVVDVEVEAKPKKEPFILITPTVHTDFSFSVIHLLSAIRMALITPHDKTTTPSLTPPDKTTTPSVPPPDKTTTTSLLPPDNTATTSLPPPDNTTTTSLPPPDKTTTTSVPSPDKSATPSLTVQQIVDRVRSNPRDPNILETQEPLLDLVRGVMKIFSSRTAPLGAKDWKPLVCYEKASKSWAWTGPVPLGSTDVETPEEVVSPKAWGVPRKTLVKLVDSFANWLKSGQETLRQIGSLPAPPAELMQHNFDEKERFKDLRAQKSLCTIPTSSEEVRAYFQKEEQLRYSIPDRAFSYTAIDGKKSIVAPLRRCGGKPTSKARDHVMLKRDRPPHVTILCLVRDAAARLPGNIGTRADVCMLIRDSQFIVDDVPNDKINLVVSGALDRLHYERDPCVQYDSERKLWVYLHKDRVEEDFEDDGTSSTKKWKRPKKDASEPDDQVTVACHEEPSGVDTDIHEKQSSAQNDKIVEVGCDDMRQKIEDDKASDIHDDGAFQQMIENELECQENSANDNLVCNT